MGIAAVFDENQRIRDLLAERDAAIASLKEINDSPAKRLELIRLKLVSRRNERFEGDGRGPESLFPGAPPPPPSPSSGAACSKASTPGPTSSMSSPRSLRGLSTASISSLRSGGASPETAGDAMTA
jgi:hypothetical protein